MKCFRRGFTMVEILVVMGVLSLIVSLLLPAVASVRESARRTVCLQRLRDLGIATHHYHDTHGMVPPCKQGGGEIGLSCWFSSQSQLLPYLEEAAVYELVNFQATFRPPNESGPNWQKEQATAMSTRVAAFLCPSDVGNFAGGINYRTNYGTGAMGWRSVEHPDSGEGIFCDLPNFGRKFRDVIDGLSKTTAFAERSSGSGVLNSVAGPTDMHDYLGDWESLQLADRVAAVCRKTAMLPPGSVGVYPYAGKYWLVGSTLHGWFNHVMPPNSPIIDCASASAARGEGAATARSMHADGVNVVMADSSTRFVNNSVALAVWRAMGTRDGLEDFAGQ